MNVLLPSIKMKSFSPRGVLFEQELHSFFLKHFTGYTVTAGNITGYWNGPGSREECNEHREYQIAIDQTAKRALFEKYLAQLARELNEETLYLTFEGKALLVSAEKPQAALLRKGEKGRRR